MHIIDLICLTVSSILTAVQRCLQPISILHIARYCDNDSTLNLHPHFCKVLNLGFAIEQSMPSYWFISRFND